MKCFMKEARLVYTGHAGERRKEHIILQKKGVTWAKDKNWRTLGILIGK